jgi:hypothetical protein
VSPERIVIRHSIPTPPSAPTEGYLLRGRRPRPTAGERLWRTNLEVPEPDRATGPLGHATRSPSGNSELGHRCRGAPERSSPARTR